jgi:hypothetical protein
MRKSRFFRIESRNACAKAPRRGTFLLAVMIGLTAVLATTRSAQACPSCAIGVQARAEVWNDAFESRLVVALLPFLIIGAICFGAERIGRPALRANRPNARTQTTSEQANREHIE